MRSFLITTAACLAIPVFADGHQQPNLSDLITDTLGYVFVRENVVIFEGEELGTFICKLDIDDAAFEAYKTNGDMGSYSADYACIPIEEFEN